MINFVISINVKSEIEADSIDGAKAIIKESLKDPNLCFTLPSTLNKHPETEKFLRQKGNCVYCFISYYENNSKKIKGARKTDLK